MLTALELLDACAECYVSPSFSSGPDGRDALLLREKTSDGTLLVFRGTVFNYGAHCFLDWLNDCRAELVERPEYPGKVHRGFADALDSLWPLVATLPPPLTIAGHSKGGALAILANARLLTSSPDHRHLPPRVVTFAAPKVGDFAFAAWTVKSPQRYENPHDWVPHLPPFHYTPVGVRVFPSDDWNGPRGLIANHEIDTGYRPWVANV